MPGMSAWLGFVDRYYDMWHRATGSTLPDDMDTPIEDRDPSQTRWMSKFRFWRMEEPTGPTWYA